MKYNWTINPAKLYWEKKSVKIAKPQALLWSAYIACIVCQIGQYLSKVKYCFTQNEIWRLGGLLSSLQWRHNGQDGISDHQPHNCLLNCLFRRRSKKTSKLRVTGLCAGNSPGTGEFPTQMASNAENVSIWWRHHVCWWCPLLENLGSSSPHWGLLGHG